MAKANILKFQRPSDFAVINVDYENSLRIGKEARAQVFSISRKKRVSPGAYIEDGGVFFEDMRGKKEKIIETKEVFIPGAHNLENVCAAVVVSKLLNISAGAIAEVLKSFRGLTYRLQFIAEINGVRYYNDSFGTTPESAIAAVRAFGVPKVLILGGSIKGSDFSELAKVIAEEKNVKAIVGIGVEWPKIKEALKSAGALPSKILEGCTNMKDIIEAATNLAEAGDVVLLAPACASFDMFKNYKDRGKQFDEVVHALEENR
jgi:UDP-N-acetylmuramoylalanine--D-glutamate ligase